MLFNKIAPIYRLFFNHQVRKYQSVFNKTKDEIGLSTCDSALDIGCGTGALCKILAEHIPDVTGLDPAEAMLVIAEEKVVSPLAPSSSTIKFIQGDVLDGLPFPDKSFDLAIASYVAHGFNQEDRCLLYAEMKRVARHRVILLDYSERRSWTTNIVEWLEGGDYFRFIQTNKDELIEQFGNLKVISTTKNSAMYICEIG